MKETKEIKKPHWMNRYLERLNSEEGLSAEEIYDEENALRAKEGLPAIKFNSVGRTLNTFGFPKSGTRQKRLGPPRVSARTSTLLKETKQKVEELSELLKEERLSHLEEEFVWLFIEGYPEPQIEGMLQLDEVKLKEIKKKFRLV